MKVAGAAAILAPWNDASHFDRIFKIRAANPFLLSVAHALLHNLDRVLVLLRVHPELLKVVHDSGKVGTGVLGDTLVHLALLDTGVDHLGKDEGDEVDQEELGDHDGFHGCAVFFKSSVKAAPSL